MGTKSRLEKIPNRDGNPEYREIDGHRVKLTRRGEGMLVSVDDPEQERRIHPNKLQRRRKKNKQARKTRRKNR